MGTTTNSDRRHCRVDWGCAADAGRTAGTVGLVIAAAMAALLPGRSQLSKATQRQPRYVWRDHRADHRTYQPEAAAAHLVAGGRCCPAWLAYRRWDDTPGPHRLDPLFDDDRRHVAVP